MKALFVRLVREESGQDLIEYALLAALIGVVLVAGMTNVKDGIDGTFTAVKTALDGSH